MEELDLLMRLAGQAAVQLIANASNTFTFTTTELEWKGRRNDISWCRLFVGDRFQEKDARRSFLPKPKVINGDVYIPSVHLKDIVSMAERTQVYNTNNGTQTERVCDLQCRKITTSQTVVSALKDYRAMCVGNNRFFIDKIQGPLPVSEALKCVVNSESEQMELVLNRDKLVELLAFIIAHNDSGGYAVCEYAQLSDNWYAVRNIIILGKETGNFRQPVELYTASISHRLRQGKRYIREYQSATLVGAGRTMDMVARYSSLNGVQPSVQEIVLPTTWDSLDGKNAPTSETWQVPATKIQYSIDQNGTIHAQTSDGRGKVKVTRPLFGHVLVLEERSSKTNCPKLVDTSDIKQQVEPFPDQASTLSLLGAVLQDSSGNPWSGRHGDYARADGIISILAKTESSSLSVSLVDTGRTHNAGNRGTWPIAKLIPVVRIQNKWYDLNTLKPTVYNKPCFKTSNVRYLELGTAANSDVARTMAM